MNNKQLLINSFKGFAMGVADIVPGVSGGTVAFITGIYETLLGSLSAIDTNFVRLILKLKIKDAFEHINGKFLVSLLAGILVALVSMANLMHYFLNVHPTPTWGLFFGLIAGSIYYLLKQSKASFCAKNILYILMGVIIGYLVVSLVPVMTPNSYPFILLSGAIGICAMILPGISGSFILLILGKYSFITGALKQPFDDSNLLIIIVFALGCLIGLLSFSKFLNWLMKKYHHQMLLILIGFMLGSLKKIWPWKKTLESITVRGKLHVLREANILPTQYDNTFWVTVTLMICGLSFVIMLENISEPKTRGVSSAG